MSSTRPAAYDHVVVEGNIGSGKTTLAKILAERWGSRLMLERFSDNPFLPKFYENPDRHAFALELSFLAERYHQNRDELNRTDLFQPGVVADYSFAKSLIFAAITLQEDELELYRSLFHIIHGRLPRPDLLIYLHCSEEKSLRQISMRGRNYEQDINIRYLRSISQGYLNFFQQQKDTRILLVNTEHLDFVSHAAHLDKILDEIQTERPIGVHHVAP